MIPFFRAGWCRYVHRSARVCATVLIVTALSGTGYYFCLPSSLFKIPYATVVEDANGRLLGAHIAADGQWRFPPPDSLPCRYKISLITYEDKRFYRHLGVDFRALGRAVVQNLKAREIVSGGSTLSMQVIRLSRPGKPRNLFQKVIEIILATRLEFRFSKEEILNLYASHAPFGGNVVGIEAASWRYFGQRLRDLSWAESALLAVLPNAPSLVFPGGNPGLLIEKRNRLLNKLYQKGYLDSLSWQLALQEPVPPAPFPLPRLVPHLVEHFAQEKSGGRITTTLDIALQERVMPIVRYHQKELAGNEIFNAAALVLDVETGNVLAYVGNSIPEGTEQHGENVDIIRSPRSTGSILKPLLYACMLHDGELLPGMLVPDYPLRIQGFLPKNYDRTFQGAVTAEMAIARSLNVPAVHLLQQHGVAKFQNTLQKLGMSTLKFSPDRYGLTLILGGAEGTLWDLCGIYASLSRQLNHFCRYSGQYNPADLHPPVLLSSHKRNKTNDTVQTEKENLLRASAIYLMYEAMAEVNRPDAEGLWQWFEGAGKIAWKTGTSFGNRDGWAIGTTASYVVGVWTGNASGEGRPLLTGLNCSAPIMFDIFRLLPEKKWFPVPWDDMIKIHVCRESGYRQGSNCVHIDSVWVPLSGKESKACPFHKILHLSAERKYRVSDRCVSPSSMVHVSWFVLPPAMEWYYRFHHPAYLVMPEWKKGCNVPGEIPSMDLLYPKSGARIFIPRIIQGKEGQVICEAVHRQRNAQIYWHLDDIFLGTTTRLHQMTIQPGGGKHILTLVDQEGEMITVPFEILSRE